MTGLRRNQVLVGDAAETLSQLPAGSIDMVLTSPPYFRLRNYQHAGQLGMEPHIDEWVARLRDVAAEVVRVLVPAGSLWLNIADSYSVHARQGAHRKGLLLGPERLLLALHEDGWLVRNKIVWAKTNGMPTSVRDRLSCSHEAVYLLTRSADYFFDLDAIRIPLRSHTAPRQVARPVPDLPASWRGPNTTTNRGLARLKRAGMAGHPLGKNPGDVWPLATSNYRGHHFATFPRALAERAIRAGCPEQRCPTCRTPYRRQLIRVLGRAASRGALEPGCDCAASSEPGIVLDPFFGSGTTAVAAELLDRDWLGIELNPAFARLSQQRLADARQARQPRPG